MYKIPLSLYLVAVIFPMLIAEKLLLFINIGLFSPYWLVLLILISITVLLKLKTMRLVMLFILYLSLFYSLIGTETGLTTCFSNNLTVLAEDLTFSNFISIAPYLFFTLFIHIFSIYLLSHKTSYKFFEMQRATLPYEIGIIGTVAFWVIYLDLIYKLF